MPIARNEFKELLPTDEPFPWVTGIHPPVWLLKTTGHTYVARIDLKRLLEVRFKEGKPI